ncbi:MFS transporter [Actinoplanes sp. NPDC051861]|uniref:MFS transporter n=1 Tax=Actinoplanes sp. NPDC051861 TaxID=3155170 RepID=UPI003433CAD7
MVSGFGRLWTAYAISTLGTWLAFDAFPLIAILALDATPAQVSLLAAAGLAVGAVVAVPLGPWVEFRRKRPVLVAMDLVRCAALLTVPVAYALGLLTLAQLIVVSVVTAAADIAFTAASGAFLKWLVPPDQLLRANARFESTTWTATVLGPPAGGAAIGLFGPVLTVVLNATSFLLSATALRGIKSEPPKKPIKTDKSVLGGWRFIVRTPRLRRLFLNVITVNALIMAPAPLLAVLMLRTLEFPPWQYGLAFAVPCLGGLLGSRLAGPMVAKLGRHRVLILAGTLRACWGLGLALIVPGPAGLALVMIVEFGLITCAGLFNPVLATERLDLIPPDRVARVLTAWSVSTKAAIASATALWGLLATVAGVRGAIAIAGALLLATPLLLPWRNSFSTPPDSRPFSPKLEDSSEQRTS